MPASVAVNDDAVDLNAPRPLVMFFVGAVCAIVLTSGFAQAAPADANTGQQAIPNTADGAELIPQERADLLLAAVEGDSEAQAKLGARYFTGVGLPKDTAKH